MSWKHTQRTNRLLKHINELMRYNLLDGHSVRETDIFLICFATGVCIPLLQFDLSKVFNLAICAGLTLIALSVSYFISRFFPRRYGQHPLFLSMLKATLMGLIGWLLATHAFHSHRDNLLDHQLEKVWLSAQGEIIGLAREGDSSYGFEMKITKLSSALDDGIEKGDLARYRNQKVRLNCYQCQQFPKSGEVWRLRVNLKRPNSYASEGVFDYEKWLFRHRFIATGYIDSKKMQRLATLKDFKVGRIRQKVKDTIKHRLTDSKTDSSVGFAVLMALIVGDKSELNSEAKKMIQTLGLSHLLAISGLHVGLVFGLVYLLCKRALRVGYRLFEFVPRKFLAYFPAFSCATVYAAFAGFSPSTQRALLMLAIYILSVVLNRNRGLLRILLLTLVLLLLFDPFTILDAGFWLSFGAVFVIALTLKTIQGMGWMKTAVVMQLGLWIGMLPMLIVFFNGVSLISPISNLILVPIFGLFIIPIALLGAVLLTFGAFFSMFSSLAQLGTLMLRFLTLLIDQAYLLIESYDVGERFYVALPRIGASNLAVISIGVLSLWFVRSWLTKLSVVTCIVVFIACFVLKQPRTNSELKATILDVGQGLSIVVEIRDRVLVYDLGPKYKSGFNTVEAVVLPFLRSRAKSKVDVLVISHGDNDHIGDLRKFRQQRNVKQVITSFPSELSGSEDCRSVDAWNWYGYTFSFLNNKINSAINQESVSKNNLSCVLYIKGSVHSLIFPGDIEKAMERKLLQVPSWSGADILVVPHHGSATSSSESFIDRVAPTWALVSAGYLNRYSHPNDRVKQRYVSRSIPFINTATSGSITMTLADDDININTYRADYPRFWRR